MCTSTISEEVSKHILDILIQHLVHFYIRKFQNGKQVFFVF